MEQFLRRQTAAQLPALPLRLLFGGDLRRVFLPELLNWRLNSSLNSRVPRTFVPGGNLTPRSCSAEAVLALTFWSIHIAPKAACPCPEPAFFLLFAAILYNSFASNSERRVSDSFLPTLWQRILYLLLRLDVGSAARCALFGYDLFRRVPAYIALPAACTPDCSEDSVHEPGTHQRSAGALFDYIFLPSAARRSCSVCRRSFEPPQQPRFFALFWDLRSRRSASACFCAPFSACT